MIPIFPAAPFAGFVVKRVWLTCDRTIGAYEEGGNPANTEFVLYRVSEDGQDKISRIDTAQTGIAAFRPLLFPGPADLDLEMQEGEGLAVDAVREGMMAPALRGFAAQVDWQFVGR